MVHHSLALRCNVTHMKRITINVSNSLYDRLTRDARDDNRSLSNHVVTLLATTCNPDQVKKHDAAQLG